MKKNRLSFVHFATAILFIFGGHRALSQSVDTTVDTPAAGFDAATNTVTLPPGVNEVCFDITVDPAGVLMGNLDFFWFKEPYATSGFTLRANQAVIDLFNFDADPLASRTGPDSVIFTDPATGEESFTSNIEDPCVIFDMATRKLTDPSRDARGGDYKLSLEVTDAFGNIFAADDFVTIKVETANFIPATPENNRKNKERFLSRGGLNETGFADAYYRTIDPTHKKMNVEDFITENGFIGDPDTEVSVSPYMNQNDLGFGRLFTMAKRPNGDVASCLYNFEDAGESVEAAISFDTTGLTANPPDPPTDPAGIDKAIAAVCMEYSPGVDKDGNRVGKPFTKFFIYTDLDRDPAGVVERVTSADLDGNGEKSVPGLCFVCHGGKNPKSLELNSMGQDIYPEFGDVGAKFLPLDVEAFEYSYQEPGFAREDLEASFKEQNEGVLLTKPKKVLKELINGWYDPDPAKDDDGNPDTQFVDFVPPDWAAFGEDEVYLSTIATSCRTCHVALKTHVIKINAFINGADSIRKEVFDRRSMPNALNTWERFWCSTNPHQPDVLDDALTRLSGAGGGGAVSCADIKKFTTKKCDKGKLKVTVDLFNEDFSGETITIDVNGVGHDVTVDGKKAKLELLNQSGPKVVTVLVGADVCLAPQNVVCN